MISIVDEKRCEICGKATRKVLFKDAQVKIYLCSRKCENGYFEILHGKDKALQEVLHYFDTGIARIKEYERYCWMTALLGIAIMLLAVLLANTQTKERFIGPFLFLVGVAPLIGSMLMITQFYKEEEKLVEKRKQAALTY